VRREQVVLPGDVRTEEARRSGQGGHLSSPAGPNCLLSCEPLDATLRSIDELGNLLNKEAVLRALQSKTMPGGLRHIRGLKDVMDVKLTEIPSVAEDALVR